MIKIQFFKIRGQSMSPIFLPNNFVLVIKHPWQKFNVGDVILVNHQHYGKIIKRICTIETQHGKTFFTLKSDNPQGVTTEQIGKTNKNQLIGKVIYQVKANKK